MGAEEQGEEPLTERSDRVSRPAGPGSNAKRRKDGDGAGGLSAAFRARSFGRTPPPTGQHSTGPERSEVRQ